jgi:hypothetical protein
MSKELAKKLIPVKEEHQKPLYNGSKDLYNMVHATLDYRAENGYTYPRGYYLSVSMESHCKGYITLHIGKDMPPRCYKLLKPVSRRSKKADAEAVALFNALLADTVVKLYGEDTCYMEYAA